MNSIPARGAAFELLKEFTSCEPLIKHALAVEGVMRFMARKVNEDENAWGITGLIHDLDYEKFPDQHCVKTREILEQRGWPPEIIRAAISHGWGICTEIEPISLMEQYLYAVDELAGFVTACALVRPSKSVKDMEVSSVRKKWKQKGFAAGVNREVIEKGAQRLGIPLESLIADVIAGMREVADTIGL